MLSKDEFGCTNVANTWLPGTACANTDHFCAGFGHSNLHLLCAAVVTWWTKFNLHGLLILLLTLQAICNCLDRSHPFFPDPEWNTHCYQICSLPCLHDSIYKLFEKHLNWWKLNILSIMSNDMFCERFVIRQMVLIVCQNNGITAVQQAKFRR